jgi:hypothetical protein
MMSPAASTTPDAAMVFTKSLLCMITAAFVRLSVFLCVFLSYFLLRTSYFLQTAGDTEVIKKSSILTGGMSPVLPPSYDSPMCISVGRPTAVTLL